MAEEFTFRNVRRAVHALLDTFLRKSHNARE
jgi:hypothetical protein